MTLLGVFVGSDPSKLGQFELWLGRQVDFCTVFTGNASQEEFISSPAYEVRQFAGTATVWSVPLIFKGGSLGSAARGDYDYMYKSIARNIAAGATRCKTSSRIFIRTGWEQNGNWTDWSAKGREASFIGSFRKLVSCFREVSNDFSFVWCPNIGQNNPAESYPGDEYVDVVGMDVYHQPRWDPLPPERAWAYMVTRPFGLQWHLEFALKRRKPVAYPEWGVCLDGYGAYVAKMAAWIETSGVVYHSYWNSNADYKGEMSRNQYPATARAFKGRFGQIHKSEP